LIGNNPCKKQAAAFLRAMIPRRKNETIDSDNLASVSGDMESLFTERRKQE